MPSGQAGKATRGQAVAVMDKARLDTHNKERRSFAIKLVNKSLQCFSLGNKTVFLSLRQHGALWDCHTFL